MPCQSRCFNANTPRLVANVLPPATYAALSGLLILAAPETADGDAIGGACISLDRATVADLACSIGAQRTALEQDREALAQNEAVLAAMVRLLAVRRSQGIADDGRAWDRSFDRVLA